MKCFQSIGHMKRFCPLTKRANEQIENAGMFNFSYQDFTYIRGYTEHKKAHIEFDYNRNNYIGHFTDLYILCQIVETDPK